MKNLKLPLLAFCFLISSCGLFNFGDYRLKIHNKSSKTIYYDTSSIFPDSTINFNAPNKGGNSQKIEPNQIKSIPSDRGDSWEETFGRVKKLSIFIFDGEVVEKESWEDIKKKYKVLKRYDITLEDAKKNDWVIVFP